MTNNIYPEYPEKRETEYTHDRVNNIIADRFFNALSRKKVGIRNENMKTEVKIEDYIKTNWRKILSILCEAEVLTEGLKEEKDTKGNNVFFEKQVNKFESSKIPNGLQEIHRRSETALDLIKQIYYALEYEKELLLLPLNEMIQKRLDDLAKDDKVHEVCNIRELLGKEDENSIYKSKTIIPDLGELIAKKIEGELPLEESDLQNELKEIIKSIITEKLDLKKVDAFMQRSINVLAEYLLDLIRQHPANEEKQEESV